MNKRVHFCNIILFQFVDVYSLYTGQFRITGVTLPRLSISQTVGAGPDGVCLRVLTVVLRFHRNAIFMFNFDREVCNLCWFTLKLYAF